MFTSNMINSDVIHIFGSHTTAVERWSAGVTTRCQAYIL